MSDTEGPLTWDQLSSRARKTEELSEQEINAACLAFSELKGIFNGHFFDIKHPLYFHFCNSAPWVNNWAVWFAGLLLPLKTHPDFQKLIHDLSKPEFYGERMTILNILELLVPVGFAFFLDKVVEVNGAMKKPDIFVQLGANDPGFFIEVSTLSTSRKQRTANEVFHQFTEALSHLMFSLDYSGQIERILSPLHLQEILGKTKAAAQKAHNENGFEALEIPGVIKIAFAAKTKKEILERWAQAHAMEVGKFAGPDVTVDEFERISFKLETKLAQLPIDRSNLVVIHCRLFEHPPREMKRFERIIHALEDQVFKHPQIGYLGVIFNWVGGNPNQVLTCRDHICINRCRFDFICDTIILLKNRFAAKPLARDVEERLRMAFINAPKS